MNYIFSKVFAPIAVGIALILPNPATATVRAADVEVGQSAPAFSLLDETGRVRTLADFKGQTLILAFYPKDFTGG